MQVNGYKLTLATVLSVVMAVATLAGSWFVWGKQTGELTQRLLTVEERQKEDRREVKERLQRIEDKAQSTDRNVIEIKAILEQMLREQRP